MIILVDQVFRPVAHASLLPSRPLSHAERSMMILVVSHVRLVREALTAALADNEDLQAFGASSRESIEAFIAKAKPSLAVVDALHPEAATLVAAVRVRIPKLSVVVLAMQDRDEDFLAWTDVGISAYLGPDTSAGDLVSAVRRVAAGDIVYPPRSTALVLSRLSMRSSERTAKAGMYALTSREREVAALLADSLSNKLIGRRLCIAQPTVKNHIHNILAKWDVQSRGEIAAWASPRGVEG
jgi:DNA-binding NarL/FixJ family response regulator